MERRELFFLFNFSGAMCEGMQHREMISLLENTMRC